MSDFQSTAWEKVLVLAWFGLLILICIVPVILWILMATFTLTPAG